MTVKGKKITVHDMTLRDGMHPKRHQMSLDQMAAIAMGLHVVGADAATTAAYRELGFEIGVAFQIVDDVLDATSTSEVLGKTAGADEANDRQSWVRVLGLTEAQARAEASWQRADALLDALPGEPVALRSVIETIYRRTS